MAQEDTKKAPVEELRVAEDADGSVVVDGVEAPPGAEAKSAAEKKPVSEDRTGRHDVDDTDSTASLEEELKGAETDEEREAIRARRRQERQSRREKRRNRDNELQTLLSQRDRELSELREHVMMLSRRSAGTELAQIDSELHQADQAVAELKDIIKDATATQQGDVVADATDRLVKVHQRAQQLTSMRNAFVENAKRAGAPAPQAGAMPDKRVVDHGMKWVRAHDWYNPQGLDLDSRIVKQIDNTIMAEGFDPRSQDYWEELSERVGRYLPHRTGNGAAHAQESGYNGAAPDQRSVRRSAVAGSGRESGAASGAASKRGSYTLSSERVRALKDAGVWDDPVKRDDAIRRYQAYDTEQAAARR